MLLSISVAACGGENSFSGGSSSQPVVAPQPGSAEPVAKLSLYASAQTLASDGSDTVTLTARAQDASLNYVSGAVISFAITSGNGGISVVSGTTNSYGVATATLDTAGDQTNRTIVVTASNAATGVSASTSISVIGTSLEVTGSSSIQVGNTASMLATLKDAGGNGIANAAVTVTSSAGNTVSSGALVTDASGQVAFTIVGMVVGVDTVRASATAYGVSGSRSLTVNAVGTSNLTLDTSPTAGITEVNIGVSQTLKSCWTQTGVVHPGKTISFATTRGTLTANSAATDASGCATVNISSAIAGTATITATATSGATTLEAFYNVGFLAVTPSTMTLQPGKAVLATGEKTTIVATVRDSEKNLVQNKRVYFNISSDESKGNLSSGYATTNASGQATVSYTAGSAGTGKDDVAIVSWVDGTAPTVTATTNLTVSGKALHLALGTSNVVQVYQTTGRSLPYMVIVTDSAGKPVANQTVTLSLWSRRFTSGQYFVVRENGSFKKYSNEPGDLQRPIRHVYSECRSEDVNRNGFLDAGEDISREDINGNGIADDPIADGRLNPGNVAAIAGQSTVMTQADGAAYFNVIYPAEYANWLEVELEATTMVEGTESKSIARILLPGIGSDYTNENVVPPGYISPFGHVSYNGTNCIQR